jgi:hypothetical protein
MAAMMAVARWWQQRSLANNRQVFSVATARSPSARSASEVDGVVRFDHVYYERYGCCTGCCTPGSGDWRAPPALPPIAAPPTCRRATSVRVCAVAAHSPKATSPSREVASPAKPSCDCACGRRPTTPPTRSSSPRWWSATATPAAGTGRPVDTAARPNARRTGGHRRTNQGVVAHAASATPSGQPHDLGPRQQMMAQARVTKASRMLSRISHRVRSRRNQCSRTMVCSTTQR